MRRLLAALALVCASVAGPALFAADPTAATHGLQTVDSAWVKAMLANDPSACAALYADDAVLVLPGTGAVKGRQAIAEAYAGWLSAVKVTAAAVMDTHYESAGNISSGWGAWTVTSVPKAGGAPTTETGTWCAIALQKDGVWKYAADHASADPAPAAASK